MKHKHHIIPRHAGGSDDPSNIIEVTVEEHAEAHRKLYEEHGRWQDRVAYLALSGQIGKEEIVKQKLQEAGRSRRGKTNSYTVTEKKLQSARKNIAKAQVFALPVVSLKGTERTENQKVGDKKSAATKKQRPPTEKEMLQWKERSKKGAAAARIKNKGVKKMLNEEGDFRFAKPGSEKSQKLKKLGYYFKGEHQWLS